MGHTIKGYNSHASITVDLDKNLIISTCQASDSGVGIFSDLSITIAKPTKEDVQAIVKLLTDGYLK